MHAHTQTQCGHMVGATGENVHAFTEGFKLRCFLFGFMEKATRALLMFLILVIRTSIPNYTPALSASTASYSLRRFQWKAAALGT